MHAWKAAKALHAWETTKTKRLNRGIYMTVSISWSLRTMLGVGDTWTEGVKKSMDMQEQDAYRVASKPGAGSARVASLRAPPHTCTLRQCMDHS